MSQEYENVSQFFVVLSKGGGPTTYRISTVSSVHQCSPVQTINLPSHILVGISVPTKNFYTHTHTHTLQRSVVYKRFENL